MAVLGFKGTLPSNVLRRIKGLLAQGCKATRRKPDLVNPLEDGSHLLPLLVRHHGKATLSGDPGVDDHGPIRELGPRCTAARGNGSYDRCNPLIAEITRNQTPWFVERPRRDFERIGCSLLAFHTIHPGVVIMSQGQKRKRDGAQIILVLQTGSKVFLGNPGWFTHSSARPIRSFLSVFFIPSQEYVFTLSVKGDLSLYYASLGELCKGFVQKARITDVHKC